MGDDGTEHATRDWVKLMIQLSVSEPLARIEADLKGMKQTAAARDSVAREAVRNRTDWMAPLLTAVVTWGLAILSHKLGWI